ncbi:hypothetical protein PUN28_005841 [Cardiocondyla obscurior]|uniref:Uncharacterized protein n=1 Tax=Cardiocondyla obscurior TaxID=286306 RepID=A0AAW2GBD6_9HYME
MFRANELRHRNCPSRSKETNDRRRGSARMYLQLKYNILSIRNNKKITGSDKVFAFIEKSMIQKVINYCRNKRNKKKKHDTRYPVVNLRSILYAISIIRIIFSLTIGSHVAGLLRVSVGKKKKKKKKEKKKNFLLFNRSLSKPEIFVSFVKCVRARSTNRRTSTSPRLKDLLPILVRSPTFYFSAIARPA